MSLIGEQVLLRIYLQSADRTPLTPTYELIVKAARQDGMAGATVLKGMIGFGSHGITQSSHWKLVEHVPVIVEIVDSGEKIVAFIQQRLAKLLVHGQATLERANVMMYRQQAQKESQNLELGKILEPLSTIPDLQGGGHMTINKDGVLLRIFIGESDQFESRPLHEAILQLARELGLAGASVLRGIEGFGASSVVHKAALLEMSRDLPIVIEIVDTQQNVEKLLPHLQQMVKEGMITMEYVIILAYRHDPADASSAGS
jgi:PII-like signaling protein